MDETIAETNIIEELHNHTFAGVYVNKNTDEVHFLRYDGVVVSLTHVQDCCESVTLESVVGDVNDLVGQPLLVAEERISHPVHDKPRCDSETYTFYAFRTVKGSVDIRFIGSSNGYYSERVDVIKFIPKDFFATWSELYQGKYHAPVR